MAKWTDRLSHAWNAFMNKDPTPKAGYGIGYSMNPDRIRFTRGNERSIITAIYNRISLDCAAINIHHVKLDANDRYSETLTTGLEQCLNLEANLDQTGRAFIQDIVASMLDEGVVAVVPVETEFKPNDTGSYDITNMRVAKILEWHPAHVRVRVYNEFNGQKVDKMIPKRQVAIIENPFYAVMNEPNTISQRLLRKLVLLDAVDEQSSSGKLDLIIQLPYIVKTEARRIQAENRRKDIENQLSSSKYGIAYTDGTEKVTQLNRSVENNLMKQIEYLQNLLYSQLGITQSIMDGSANEETMINYYSRTIEPIMSAIADEFKRKFLTKTARTKKHTIYFYRDPFKLVPVSQISDIADKFTRNEIMTSNEIRQIVGMKPSMDPEADELRNKNLNKSEAEMQEEGGMDMGLEGYDDSTYESDISALDDLDRQIEELEGMV